MLLLIFLDYTTILPWLSGELINWAISIWIFSYLIGIYNMFKTRIEQMIRRAPGWQYGIVLIISFFALFGMAFLPHDQGYNWAVLNVYTPIRMAIRLGGLINMVFLYRGARARSLDSALILLVVCIIILNKSAIGPIVLPIVTPLGDWINNYPNVGVMRAITAMMALGLLTVFIRALLGLERTYLGEIAGRFERE
jgi:hypothetical protein